MRKLLETYKNLIRDGYIEAININVYKLEHQPQPQRDDEDSQIPHLQFLTGFVSTVEMDDFQDDTIDAIDHINYLDVEYFEFKLFNDNEEHAPALKVNIIIRSDDNEI